MTPGIGISASHNFLHLTLQEYLAAVNYSQQLTSPQQLSLLLTQNRNFRLDGFLLYYGKKRELNLSSSTGTHWPVLLFVAGRTKLSGISTSIFKAGLHHNYDDDVTVVAISLMYLLYETQSPQLIQSTLVTSIKYLSVHGSSALDWFVIGYCIANSTSTWRVEIDSNDRPEYFHQLVMGLRLGPEECSRECRISSLYISGHWTGNLKILSNLQLYTKSVTEIKLVGNKQRGQHDLERSEKEMVSEQVSACYPMVEKFRIENVESSQFFASLLSQHSNIHILSLNKCNLSSVSTSSLIHFLQSPKTRLHKLTLNDCTIQISDHANSESAAISHQLQMKLTSPTGSKSFSLKITSSLIAINYILSQPHQFYANMLIILKVIIDVSGTTDSLQTSLYPNVVTLEIVSKLKGNRASILFSSHKNKLHTLSLTRCHLSNEGIRSFIHFLQSPSNTLHKLTLDDCTIQIPDHANSESAAVSHQLQMELISPTASKRFSLKTTGSLIAINYILSQPHQFYANALTILKVIDVSGTTDSLQTSLYPNVVTIEIVSKSKGDRASFLFSSHENKLHTLSLTRCHLSNEGLRSFIHFLQSPNNRLQKLTLDDCTIKIPDHNTNSTAILYQMKLISPSNTEIFSLEITGSLIAINYILSQPHLFYANTLTILKVANVSRSIDLLQIDTSLYPSLEKLDITSEEENDLLLHISVLVSSQQSNFHLLSMKKCNLTIHDMYVGH